jgi:branched-chain amino acid transport system substrate-binding protein
MRARPFTWALTAASSLALGWPILAQPQGEIVVGMSTALSGPASALGTDMRAGVLAALEEANRAGGVRGQHLRLVTLDDGYEPSRTAPNMRKLVNEEKVVAIIGNVGTPTAVAAIPIAVETGTPFIGAFTGAGVLRKNPPDRCVINFRASYAEETGAMVDALIDRAGLKPEEIAFFTQRDTFGDAGHAGGMAALRRHGLTDEAAIAHGRFERNTEAVENALADILAARRPAKAVVMVGTYKPCARFITLARQNDLNASFLNVSFVGPGPLAAALQSAGDGVIITQVVPHPSSNLKLVREYRSALSASDTPAQPGFGSLEGYTVARMFLLGLERIDGPIGRESILAAMEGLGQFDLGIDVPLQLSKTEHQASHQIWPTVIRAGEVVPATWDELFPRPRAEGQ